MRVLELKIPPGVVALIVGAAMGGAARLRPALGMRLPGLIWVAAALAVAGVGVIALAIIEFRRAKTTFNPMRPEGSAALVTSGVYRWTRNPMYVGALLLLSAWALVLGNSLALLGLPVFFVYITRYQIIPEERVLAARFGADYIAYLSRVRRWL